MDLVKIGKYIAAERRVHEIKKRINYCNRY